MVPAIGYVWVQCVFTAPNCVWVCNCVEILQAVVSFKWAIPIVFSLKIISEIIYKKNKILQFCLTYFLIIAPCLVIVLFRGFVLLGNALIHYPTYQDVRYILL
jgi:hypothetical protein